MKIPPNGFNYSGGAKEPAKRNEPARGEVMTKIIAWFLGIFTKHWSFVTYEGYVGSDRAWLHSRRKRLKSITKEVTRLY